MKSLLPKINTSDGIFHNGNPATGEQGTRVTDTWLNDVQDRLLDVQSEAHYVLQQAGLSLKENEQNQLYQAIVKIIESNRRTASTTGKGEVQLTDDTGLDSDKLALTARAGKKLAQLIATVQAALNNYIPTKNRSSSVTSTDENNVATSKAVKTAYDLANTKISKSGDEMTGELRAPHIVIDNDNETFLSLISRNSNNCGVDMSNYSAIPQVTIRASDMGGFSTAVKIFTTRTGQDFSTDRREHTYTLSPDGAIWTATYGWLHDCFATNAGVVKDVRLGGVVERALGTEVWNDYSPGFVVTGFYNHSDDLNKVDVVYLRPMQKYINGAWVTVSVG